MHACMREHDGCRSSDSELMPPDVGHACTVHGARTYVPGGVQRGHAATQVISNGRLIVESKSKIGLKYNIYSRTKIYLDISRGIT